MRIGQLCRQIGMGVLIGSAILISHATPFSTIEKPSEGPQEVVGSYANGCLFGASHLPERGVGYQTMRQSRHRHFGDQSLIAYIINLGYLRAEKGELLLIGDLSQPRGGRMPSDHASHQIGLDVDIWLYPMTPSQFKPRDIEELSMRSVVNRAEGRLNHYWREEFVDLIADAADDPRVDRIFINPVIKAELCRVAPTASWQYRIRPWFGHDAHFHVRLKCPPGSPECVTQAPIPKVSGCDGDLQQWIIDQQEVTRNPKKPQSRGTTAPRILPSRCQELLNH